MRSAVIESAARAEGCTLFRRSPATSTSGRSPCSCRSKSVAASNDGVLQQCESPKAEASSSNGGEMQSSWGRDSPVASRIKRNAAAT